MEKVRNAHNLSLRFEGAGSAESEYPILGLSDLHWVQNSISTHIMVHDLEIDLSQPVRVFGGGDNHVYGRAIGSRVTTVKNVQFSEWREFDPNFFQAPYILHAYKFMHKLSDDLPARVVYLDPSSYVLSVSDGTEFQPRIGNPRLVRN